MEIHSVNKSDNAEWLVLNHDLDRPLNVSDINLNLIVCNEQGTLIDPGGIEIFPTVVSTVNKIIPINSIKNIIVTSADPQSASSLALWKQVCSDEVNIYVPSLLGNSLAHLDSEVTFSLIPDEGLKLEVSPHQNLILIPSHHFVILVSESLFIAILVSRSAAPSPADQA